MAARMSKRFFACLILCVTTCAGQESDLNLLARADHFSDLYNWADANPLYVEAEAHFVATGDNRNATYAKCGRIRGSMETLNLPEASDLLSEELRSPVVQNDPRLRLMCLAAKGDIDGEIDSAPALADWTEALKVAKSLNDPKWESRASGEIGMQQFVQGNLTEAKQRVGGALVTAIQEGDIGAQVRYLGAIGTALAMSRLDDQGIMYLDKAIALSKKYPDTGYPFVAIAGKVQALINKRDYSAASKLASEAEQEARAHKKEIKLDQLLLLEVDILLAQGKLEDATATLQEAATIAQKNQSRLFAEAEMKLAEVHQRRGDLKTAVAEASAAVEATGDSKDMYLAPERMRLLAELEVALGNSTAADELYQRATDIIEGMVSSAPDTPARLALLSEMSPIFVSHFVLAAESGRTSDAFSIIEQVRGRIAVDSILNQEPSPTFDFQTEDRIRRLKVALVRAGTMRQRRSLLDDLFVAEQMRWSNRTEKPPAAQPPQFEMQEVQRELPGDQAVLEYVLGDVASYCLVLERSSARIVKITSGDRIERLADAYIAEIRAGELPKQNARLLYAALVQPLDLNRAITSLVVVPDGVLHLLPFSALTDRSGTPLVAKYTIWYSPSAGTALALKRRQHPPAPKLFLGFGGVQYGEETLARAEWPKERSAYYDTEPSKLPDLPGSAEEIESASATLGTRRCLLRLGTEGTETAFKASGVDEFRIIHLAVHGIANAKNPDRAALVFRPSPPADDGFLEPREILQLRLNADLVVLSACETAVGHLQGEEGITNLARAFLDAGARSVVSTLWAIDDSYSLFLMKNFYRYVREGETTASALRRSQLDLLRKFGLETSPSAWAAFTVLGMGDTQLFPKTITRRANANE